MIIKISQRKGVLTLLLLSIIASITFGLAPSGQIRLFPSSENSPSIYLLPFTVQTALPTGSYLLVTMDWYTSPLLSYNCILVNSSIGIDCTNLANATFPLTFTLTNIAKLNPQLPTSKTIAILLKSNLLANTEYFLQLHLYNVISNIQKISPSIEMYSISSKGLIYQANSNFGAVVNSLPINNLMAVSILNTLSSNTPGSTSTLRAEITISQPVSTSLSTFIFVVQNPFSFSVGSIPTTIQSTLYATSPIPLYSAPSIHSYEVISPNIFKLIFNEKFTVGRKFIVQINEINNPFIIASTNISIYSLNYNTLSPLEAFEMLYPIATVPYPLTVSLGLPFNAPFQGPMQFYQNINQFVQLQISIPYSVPDGYSIRIKLNDADLLVGTAYSSLNSLTYDPIYTYFATSAPHSFTISGMGPIPIGTTVSITFQIKIISSSLFRCTAYIDKQSVIQAFSSTSYLYEGLIESSGITSYSFYSYFNDNKSPSSGWNERVKSTSSIDSLQVFTLSIYQDINSIATSSSSYIDLYFSPNVVISNSFDPNQDCQLRQSSTQGSYVPNSCTVSYTQAPGYLRITIKPNSVYSSTVPNLFPYRSTTYIILKNMMFSLSTSNKNIYPLYMTLYKSDVVGPTTYNYLTYLQAIPEYDTLPGVSLTYVNNFYSNLGSTNYQTYPGFLRFQSTTPTSLDLVIQPNTQLTLVFFASFGIQSISGITNMGSYPCTSNIPIKCTFYKGVGSPYSQNQIFLYDRIMVTFLDLTYSTTPFHIIVPDTQINANNNYFYYQLGFYNRLLKDWSFSYSGFSYRVSSSWTPTKVSPNVNLAADITGKAGAYRQNVSITVYYSQSPSASKSFIILSTQWSFFQNGISSLSAATLALGSPPYFGSNVRSPLGLYVDNNMYLTIIPFVYSSSSSPFKIYLDNVHMPYTYDLPNYYIYVTKASDRTMDVSNEFIMTNGGTLYSAPLQSLTITCQDNALGVSNTYCTVTFGTSNPLLGIGNVRIVFSGMSVATSTCSLTTSGGTKIPVSCSSSTDKKNLTVTLLGSGFYTAGNFTLVTYGVGITAGTLSQSITLYLYDSTIQYIIESGVRILMTTVASLSYISLSQIRYSYMSPLSYNTMFIQFYLPRMLYKDEQFAFVIGQDLSDVNTEVSRLRIVIQNQNGTLLYPLFTIDNINYLIIFDFIDPAVLIPGSYVMTIYGICTPASQSNGAFNMIYRRTYDFTYTIVNSVNVIFPVLNSLITSDISMSTLFNTEGFKQQLEFTITNSVQNIDSQMIWVFNFPSYYSPQLFQEDAYCMIDTAVLPCSVDPNTPFQLIATGSPKTINAGTSYKITLVGIAAPRALYTTNKYMSRYIFVGVLANSDSTQFAERTLLLPYQNIQKTVNGVVRVRDMLGISPTGLFSFSSIYAKFELDCNVQISTGSRMFFDLPSQFDNFNNIGFNAMIVYSSSTISVSTTISNRRIQIPISIDIPASTIFQLHFPNFPTPKTPCTTRMSEIIVTVTPSTKLSITSASTFQGNSAPSLTFIKNTRYISFNHDQTVTITAGTYSQAIDITASDNNDFLTNINIGLQSTGFTFEPAAIFLPIGETKRTFYIGADSSLVPVVYFYQATKTQEVNSQYQKTLNMNIQVTNNPVLITLPASLDMPKGGCTPPYIIKLTNTPFQEIYITYTYDNAAYGEQVFYPNPWTTPRELKFTSIIDNNTLSFCSTNSLSATQIPITFHVTGTNYKSYSFTPSAVVNINVISVANSPPTLSLVLKNQQKTFLDVNFTSNVDGTIFYQVILGSSSTPLSLQQMQVNIKNNKWLIQAPSFFMNRIYTKDIDNRLSQFYQTASTSTKRIDSLIPQTAYTICGYLVNNFGVSSNVNCLRVSTMTWGSIIKAKLSFSQTLTDQQLNNILCFFTAVVGTSQFYLIDMEGNSCGNRKVENIYYKYTGITQKTEKKGTIIYLITNPTIIGTDPSPLAFTNLFTAQGQLSISTLSAAQSQFSITYLSGTYINSYSARQLTSLSQAAKIIPYFQTPVYSSATNTITISNVRAIGKQGTIYFVLVLYKRISTPASGITEVNIRMNYVPTAEEVLNCQNWDQVIQTQCARAVYTGVSALTITFTSILPDSVYQLYYIAASEFPLRPIVTGQVHSQSIVTYSWQGYNKITVLIMLLAVLIWL